MSPNAGRVFSKMNFTPSCFRFGFCALLFVIGPAPRGLAAEGASPAKEDPASHTPEQTTALEVLDAAITRIEKLWASDPDPRHKESVRLFVEAHRSRFEAIRKSPFDQSKYDELTFDISVELQRLLVWLSPPKTPPPKSGGTMILEGLSPDPQNRAEVDAALKVADDAIRQLEPGATSPPAKERLALVKSHRSELGAKFSKSKWEALVDEIKAARR